uniref:Caspase family p20 domain-containing protein n=1 Tax=Anopheles maculatus TaxID=74869 RepID=A0A182SBI4_9DIPT
MYRCDVHDINQNYTANGVREKMESIATQNFTDHSCLMVFIVSHGGMNDTIMGSDGSLYSLGDDIVKQCTSNPTLNGKPKIIVVQACRTNATTATVARKSPLIDDCDVAVFKSSYHNEICDISSDSDPRQGDTFMQTFLRLLHATNQQSIIHVNTLLAGEFYERK